MDTNNIPYCKNCGIRLAVYTTIGLVETSDFVGGHLCYDCQVEYCINTNCYTCKQGNYPDCDHLERKRSHMNQEN